MKKKICIILASVFILSGCEKLGETGDRIKEKLSWTYSEEVDKLNNTKIQKAKKEFKNAENTVQADVEFQCNAGKTLVLQIGAYQTKLVDGSYPGATLKLKSTENSGAFIKTRTGEYKLAFPVLADSDYNNIAKISLRGVNFGGVTGIVNSIMMAAGNVELNAQGYRLAADGNEIIKFFKVSEWVLEVPTLDGKIILEIDLSHKNIQKVFEACSWTPDFLKQQNTKAAANDSKQSEQQNASSKTTTASNTTGQKAKFIIKRIDDQNRDMSLTVLAVTVDTSQVMELSLSAEQSPKTHELLKSSIGQVLILEYDSNDNILSVSRQ